MRLVEGPLLGISLLALAGCAARAPTASAPSPAVPVPAGAAELAATRPAVERLLAAELAKLQLPSLAFGLVTRGGLVYFVGLGERDGAGTAVTPETVYRIGSITKTVTGVALLQLRDAGRLDLDDPVSKWLPEIASARAPTADSGPIRIRHLVTHSSGLPRMGELHWGDGHEVTRLDLRDAAAHAVLELVPGTRSAYSNLAMALAGPIVARAAQEPYRAYVDQHILGPLGMTHTVWDREAVPEDRLAQGWAEAKGGGFTTAGAHWRFGAAEGMGGLYSSVADLSRYVSFQLSAWPPRDGPDEGPLRRSSVRESHLLAGLSWPAARGFGVNWIVSTEPRLGHVVFHNGQTEGYHAVIFMLPERGVGVVALGPATFKLDAVAHRALELALGGAGRAPAEPAEPVSPEPPEAPGSGPPVAAPERL
jgi:CubicO group peptidase (beta-lactamase class C family)